MAHLRPSSKRSFLLAGSVVVTASMLLSACGSKATDEGGSAAASCVDTSGDTIKDGSLTIDSSKIADGVLNTARELLQSKTSSTGN